MIDYCQNRSLWYDYNFLIVTKLLLLIFPIIIVFIPLHSHFFLSPSLSQRTSPNAPPSTPR